MSWKSEWKKVIFTDEKKFNLDGPDGFHYYYHDLRKEEVILSRNHSRTGGVMVWGAISYYGVIDLVTTKGIMNAESYKTILENTIPKVSELFGPIPWIFQQDNAPIHMVRMVKNYFQTQNVDILPWPAYSPDLNIIENVWGWLSRKVYEGGKQYEDKEALIKSINDSWKEISLNYLGTLYNSISDRIFEVILKQGGSTHY